MKNPCGEIVIGKKEFCILGLIPNHIPEEQHDMYLGKKFNIKGHQIMGTKQSRYGYTIPDNWLQCKGCPDMINEDIANIYAYGYCSDCCRNIPTYIPAEQWGDYLNAYHKKEV